MSRSLAVGGGSLENYSGAVMLFQQSSAPLGWTKQTTHDDCCMRVVSGNISSGGTTGFSTVYNNVTLTGSGALNVSGVGDTTLTTQQMAAHDHRYYRAIGSTLFPGPGPQALYGRVSGTQNSSATGGGGAHTHTFSPTTMTFTGNSLNLAIKYVDLIIASKD